MDGCYTAKADVPEALFHCSQSKLFGKLERFLGRIQLDLVFCWKRNLRPQDLTEKAGLDRMLNQVYFDSNACDKLIWVYNKLGQFSTKSFTQQLDKLKSMPHPDAIKVVWKGLVPHRIEVFVWIACLAKVTRGTSLPWLYYSCK